MSDISELYRKLLSFPNVMRLNPPALPKTLNEFEKKNKLILPDELRELLQLFNGGEIFVPGTVIYSAENDGSDSLIECNRQESRGVWSIPDNYLLFANLNFGDLVCINLNEPFDVIQWDHEQDEQFNDWEGLAQWLYDEIDDYEEYKDDIK